MNNTVWTFGLIAGGILAAMVVLSISLMMADRLDFENGEVIGYTSMVVAFILVFFGIRSYRDKVAGGTITFGRAFKVGILIVLVASAVYVITWEIMYYGGFASGFTEKYTAAHLAKMRAEGATELTIDAEAAKMTKMWELYDNPLVNVGMTFLEVFPVGLIMTLIAAATLRRKT